MQDGSFIKTDIIFSYRIIPGILQKRIVPGVAIIHVDSRSHHLEADSNWQVRAGREILVEQSDAELTRKQTETARR